jgi:hypothetical protein
MVLRGDPANIIAFAIPKVYSKYVSITANEKSIP